MRPDCIVEVERTVGRKVSKAEAAGIEAAIVSQLRNLARAKPQVHAALRTPTEALLKGEA